MSAGRRKGAKIGPLPGCVDKERGPGAWLYAARIAANLTIDQLAEKAGISRRSIIRIENDPTGPKYRTGARKYVEYRLRRALDLVDGI